MIFAAAALVCGTVAYPATVERIVDGDTAEVEVSLGLGVEVQDSARLWGIDAPERYTEAGPAATEHLGQLMPVGSHVWAELRGRDGRDKYGRLLVRFFTPDCRDVGQAMVDNGYAVERWRE